MPSSNDEPSSGYSLRYHDNDTLARVQRESKEWREQAYPDSVHDPLAQFAGVAEEVGELAHAVLKHHQGIRGYNLERTRREVGDAIADAIIYMTAVANCYGLDVADELSKAWAHVKARNLVQNSDPGKSASAKRGFAEMHRDHPKPSDTIEPSCSEHGNTCVGDRFHTDALAPIIDHGTNFGAVAIDRAVYPEFGAAYTGEKVVPVFTKCPGKPHDGHFAVDQLCPLDAIEDDNAFGGQV